MFFFHYFYDTFVKSFIPPPPGLKANGNHQVLEEELG